MQTQLKKYLSPAERLIVAADFSPLLKSREHRTDWVRGEVLMLADQLADLGVYLKVNSALRAVGFSLITEIQERGLRVFADLKLYDIPSTLKNDGLLLAPYSPELLTVACAAGTDAMQALKERLPNTEVLGVTVLTSLDEDEVNAMFTCSTPEAVLRLARFAERAGIDGLISSPAEATMLRDNIELLMSLNTPAIRPAWSIVEGDDQNLSRIMTPAKARAAGADRVVIGRPITQDPNPREVAERSLEELAAVPD